jgi:hypothetical protein
MLIRESDMNNMKRFISKDYGDLNIDDVDNKGCIIISQCRFSLYDDGKNKIMNME